MKNTLIAVCIILFLLHFSAWFSSEVNENESSSIASSIYVLCLILIYIFT
nr:MAG TPA: putative secreted protein [Caudoviricetes sp.]